MSLILRARAVADGLGIAEILAFSGLATHGRTFPTLHQSTRWPHEPMKFGVTSSCLCKYGEGAGFPFQIESLEDGVNDSIHAFYVDKAHHGAGSPSHFYEAALDHVGGAQFPPQVPGKGIEGQQLRQVAFQPPHHGSVLPAPARPEPAKGRFRLGATFR